MINIIRDPEFEENNQDWSWIVSEREYKIIEQILLKLGMYHNAVVDEVEKKYEE